MPTAPISPTCIDRRTAEAEQAIDRLRQKFGDEAVIKGLALDSRDDDEED